MQKYSINDFIGKLRQFNAWYDGVEQAAPPGSGGNGGVNVVGYLRDESGLGAAARRYLQALQASEVPVALRDLSELSSNRSEDRTLTAFDSGRLFDINLVCVNAGEHYAAMRHLGEEFFENRYNIGVWWWELPQFPPKWYDRFAYYDEVWVATSFIANALSPISPVPVVRIPPVLTPRSYGNRAAGRTRLEVPDEEFVFLFVFDFHSHFERKNPMAIIEAFEKAFRPTDPVRLIIKCVNADDDPANFAAMADRAQWYPISIHDAYWTPEEMRDLMAACDAYVSLHRSEGAGLSISDAMAMGKPVIATGWSGNMDFMNTGNSYPVAYRLVEIEQNVGPYGAGELWAEPSIEDAAAMMRQIYDKPDAARARGAAARLEITTSYTENAVAQLIEQRLEVISTRDHFAKYKRQMKSFFRGYQQLLHEIREIVDAQLPPNATVAVVSKGDNELMHLGGRRTIHFPQSADGLYAGHHPADSREAIDHLETLRDGGAEYLLLPGTSYWWLEHYQEFARSLEAQHHRVWKDEHCIIYELTAADVGVELAKRALKLDELVAALESLTDHEAALHTQLLDAHNHLLRRDFELNATITELRSELHDAHYRDQEQQAALQTLQSAPAAVSAEPTAALPATGEAGADSSQESNEPLEYDELIARIRGVVHDAVPRNATVLVISKGDEALVELSGRNARRFPLRKKQGQAWHFPRSADGFYAGHYPGDSQEAIDHLESLRQKGAAFLLIPATSFWWLDHYSEFSRHLEEHYSSVWRDEACVIYRLNDGGRVATGATHTA
jgi:glycosyltransferase involved in cell wall biosynthesis